MVSLDGYGLCRMVAEEGSVLEFGFAKVLWNGVSSIITGNLYSLGSFFMEINEDDLSSGALYDHLLTSFFADFMHSIETSRFIVTRGFGFRRVITCSFFFNSLKKIRSYLESYIRIYGDMLNGTIVDDHRKVMGWWSMDSRLRMTVCLRNTMSLRTS